MFISWKRYYTLCSSNLTWTNVDIHILEVWVVMFMNCLPRLHAFTRPSLPWNEGKQGKGSDIFGDVSGLDASPTWLLHLERIQHSTPSWSWGKLRKFDRESPSFECSVLWIVLSSHVHQEMGCQVGTDGVVNQALQVLFLGYSRGHYQ